MSKCLTILCLIISIIQFKNIRKYIIKKYNYINYRRVNLLYDNNVFINGEITKDSINIIINEFDKINKNNETKKFNLIIDSNGGNYMEGYKLIHKMKDMQENKFIINCYTINAKSTAFEIFQYCNNRYVTIDTVLFQHNATTTFTVTPEEFENIKDFEIYYKTIFEPYLTISYNFNKYISNKINMEYKNYIKLVRNDWTVIGEQIIEYKLADEIVKIVDYMLLNGKVN